MSEFPEKAPMQHEHIVERSRTVAGLFDDTIRGANRAERPWSVADLAPSFKSNWTRLYHDAKEALQNGALEHVPEKQAQNSVILLQLEKMNDMRAQERNDLLGRLLLNEQRFSLLEESAAKVQEALRVGYFPAVMEQQAKIIKTADAINQKTLSFELGTILAAGKKRVEGKQETALVTAAESVRTAMAAPFIERARMAAFMLSDKKPYQAERLLNEAMQAQIPADAMESNYVKELRKNASEQLYRLRVENHLVELYDANLSKLDFAPQDGVLTRAELEAASQKTQDENLLALTDFLCSNFNYLTRNQWSLFGKTGIRRADLVDYEKQRAKGINDLRL